MGWLDKLEDAFVTAQGMLLDTTGVGLLRHVPAVRDSATAKSYAHGRSMIIDGVEGIGHDLFVQPYQDAQAPSPDDRWYTMLQGGGKAVGKGLKNALIDAGGVLGGAIEGVTSPLQSVGVNVPEALNDTYEFADRNLATTYLAANLADRNGKFFDPSIFQSKTWTDASQLREDENLTFGQAFALARMDGDITDAAERAKYKQGTFFKVTSATTDLLYPIALDPLAIGAKGTSAARLKYITKPLKATDDFDDIMATKRIAKVNADLQRKTGAQINQKYPELTPEQSHVLAGMAKEGSSSLGLRSMMGDEKARDQLARFDSVYSAQIERLKGNLADLHAAGHFDNPRGEGFFDPPDSDALIRFQNEISSLEKTQDLNARAVRQYNLLQQQPRTSALKEAKYQTVRSDWYQKSKFATPIRMYYNMRPSAFVAVDDPNSIEQLQRMLDHSALSEASKTAHLDRYLSSNDPFHRADTLDQAIVAAQQSILVKHNIHPDDQVRILEDARKGRSNTNGILAKRSYDGEGRGTVEIVGDDGHVTRMALPLHHTQNVNLVNVPDLTALDKFAARHSPNRPLTGRLDEAGQRQVAEAETYLLRMGETALTTAQGLWKASTLLRVAYPFRVVGEEQVRMMALFGAMAPLKYAASGTHNLLIGDPKLRAAVRQNYLGKFIEDSNRVPSDAEFRALSKQADAEYKQRFRVRGFRNTSHLGVNYEPFMGGTGRFYADLIASRYGFDRSLGRDALALEKQLRDTHGRKTKGTGAFEGDVRHTYDEDMILADGTSLKAGQVNPNWQRGWTNAVTRQIAVDPVARMMLQGKTDSEILAWTKTADGRKHMGGMHPQWREDPERWLAEARGQVEAYLPTPALREATLKGRLPQELVEREFEAYGERPIVHAEILAQHLAGHSLVDAINTFTGVLYKALAQAPTEVLSRNQAANHAYTQAMRRSIELHGGRQALRGETIQITDQQLRRYQTAARNQAVQTVKKNFYDLTTESDMSHALRFISPFFGAFQETIGVWSRLSIQNPSFVLRLHDVWEAPDRAGFTVTDPNGDDRLIIPLPGKGITIPGVGTIDNLNLSKKGLNTILNLPGVGPVGTIPVVEVLKNRPDLADNTVVQFLYPYGVPSSIQEAVSSKTIRNFELWRDPDYQDKRYLTMWNGIYQTEYARFRQGLRPDEPTLDEISGRAHKMQLIRLLTDFIAPTQVKFDSPYQPFADTYKRMLAENPDTADERFYTQFGEDYFQFTSHISKNVAGVPATLEGWEQSKQFGDLIAKFPEIGSAIVGQGAWQGEFNSAVYAAQARTPLGLTGSNYRDLLSPEQVVEAPKVELGWLEFRKMNNAMLTELESRGLERFTDKGAQDIRATRTNYIHNVMSEKYPEWYAQYSTRDSNRANERAEAFEQVAWDPRMEGRTDMAGVREYLDARNAFLTELRSRKAQGRSGRLEAKENGDMQDAWAGFTSDLMRRNASFQPLYLRWFDADTLEVH